MKIGILGTGHIGKTLVRELSAAGHEVKIANSRGPETIEPDLLRSGARAVTSDEALADVEVVIMSIPLNRLPALASRIASLPGETVVIDTSNYYPFRDERIEAIDAGQVESLWVAEQLGRPIAKAWNAIGSASLAKKGKPKGTLGRMAIPVAADREHDRQIAMTLVEDTGLDAFDAGTLADSWRQQPGAPAYLHRPDTGRDGGGPRCGRKGASAEAPRSRGRGDAGASRRWHHEPRRGLGRPPRPGDQHVASRTLD